MTRDFTDDERAVMRALQEVADAAGRAVATMGIKGASYAQEELAHALLRHAQRAQADYLASLKD